MVLPAILGGLASGIGGGVASGLFGLFGKKSNQSQTQSFDPQAFLKSYSDQMKSINNDLISYFDQKTDQYEGQLNQYKQQYSNPQTQANFKGNFQSILDTANNAVDSGAMSTDQAKNWFENLAFSSGLTPGSTVNDKGNTLLDVMTAFDTKKMKNMPAEWNNNLNVTFNDFLGRSATKDELAKYNMKDYQNIDNVVGSLSRNNRDFYDRNVRLVDPSMAAARDFWGGGATYENPYARFGLDPKTGKPLDAKA